MKVETSRTSVVVALSFCAIILCTLAVSFSTRKARVDRRVSNVAASRTGNWLAAGTAQGKITVWNQAIANAGHWPSLWDARSGVLLGRLTTHREFATFRPIAFDDRRGTILMGSQDGRVYAWNLSNRQLVASSPPQSAYVDTLTVSTTGWVVFAGFGKSVELWNPDNGQRWSWTAARPTSNLILGPDGTSIIFGTANGAVEFWDIGTGKRGHALKVPGT